VTEAATMIEVQDLRKSIRNGARTVDILKGISFTVARGQFVAIMGASGSGKSTLLGLLAGLDTPSAGEVRLNGESADANEGQRRARELLESVGLSDRLDHYPVQLSGGEQQRVALARAFILRPPIVLADEPTGNLDTTNGAHVLDLLLHLNRTLGTTLVLVTHDPVLAGYADRRIVLRDGSVISDEIQQPVSLTVEK
jgi:putative ABC transport system ATP-binding protein